MSVRTCNGTIGLASGPPPPPPIIVTLNIELVSGNDIFTETDVDPDGTYDMQMWWSPTGDSDWSLFDDAPATPQPWFDALDISALGPDGTQIWLRSQASGHLSNVTGPFTISA